MIASAGETGDETNVGVSHMRKGALLLAVLMVAAAPSAALAAKKKAKAPAAPAKFDTTKTNSNEASARFVRDGLMQPQKAWDATVALANKK
jgi:hypothetical protein